MRPKQFTITAVEATPNCGLMLDFADGERLEVSLAGLLDRYPALERLKDVEFFCTAAIADHGAAVVWGSAEELELAADNLRARAVERAGGVSHEFIWNWMARNGLNLDTAALALGVSRRMLAYYRSGAKPVPRTVALACRGWEADFKEFLSGMPDGGGDDLFTRDAGLPRDVHL